VAEGTALLWSAVSTSRKVELLYFKGCPHHREALKMVERIAADQGISLDLRLINVASLDEAVAQRFLGSPTIRVDGHDVEPGADRRETFVHACRVYQTDSGLSGQPSEDSIRAALRER
jgi:hypothetical protein